ncbi:fatty acyl-AMP ligase [Polyangium jinanense]|uniref:Fatty acyl-AMP ligase n=1 Tax=Polyangium jinanense TaxID=2829994 RepID=A0A9X3WXL1_9BACT|nr:fatty acyl-AMP ligase [Polyangium jinanense]MDC3952544.1 fatty acyl-AMP ligase [Polyangium jinanense]MDC3980172.1 fatty acyl-AMP ligase [Polyangium jinanense]
MSAPSPRTVAQAIEDAAASSSTGYRFLDESPDVAPFHSYADVERMSARYGGAMQAMGLRKGDRIALILPDNADFVFAFLGAVRAGIIPVPIYPPTGLGKLSGYLENTLHIVAKSGARVLLTSSEIKKILGTIQAQAPGLEKVVAVEGVRTSSDKLRPEKIDLDDVCFLQFTSGSTARPKGVTLTHRNLAANVHAIMPVGLSIRDGVDHGVSWLPLYHDMGLIGFVIAPVYHRNSITFLPPLLFLKRPARWLESISKYKGTISFGPNFAYALAVKRIKESEMEGLDLSSWRIAGCGAEPIRAENLRAFAEKFSRIGFDERAFVCCYGMAESTLAVSFSKIWTGVRTDVVDGETLWSKGRAEPASEGSPRASGIVECGMAFEGHEIKTFAPDDEESARPLPEREVGELRIRGPSVMQGYWNDPEVTKRSFAGGFLRTGDLGYIAEGKVYICGRSKEVVIVNGRNYYPQDIEWEASQVEGVRKGNVIAFGTMKGPSDRERVVIAFETGEKDEAGKKRLEADVRKAVQQSVGLTVDDVVPLAPGVLPKTSSGKLQRAKTRELYESGELLGRTSAREVDKLDLVKEIAKSQIGYFRHRLFGKSDD